MRWDYQLRIESILTKIVSRETLRFKLISSRKTQNGFEFAYRIPSGYSCVDVEQHLDELFAICGCGVDLEDRGGVVIIKIYTKDFPEELAYKNDMITDDKKTVLLGFDRNMNPVFHNFKIPHLMIAGMSGYGKTDLVRWIIFNLINKYKPNELEIKIIDLKGFSFLPFQNIPHVEIVDDLSSTKRVLSDAKKVLDLRKKLVKEANNRNIIDSFKWLMIVIDEASQISPSIEPDKEIRKIKLQCDKYCADISQIGREPKVGLIYCTQRPDANVINPLVKANIDTKIGFRVGTVTNSEIILDRIGAEKLPFRKSGRCLVLTDDLTEIQVPYVGNDEAWIHLLKPLERIESHEQKGNEETGNFEDVERPTHHLDSSSLDVFSREWKSGETGFGNASDVRKRKDDRGEKTGNRQVKNMETNLVWTFPNENKKTSDAHELNED